jgi:DNA repair protein RecO (recombination protein O)
MAEASEHLLPPQEVNERFFRLLVAVTGWLESAGRPGLWPAVNYFTIWAVRLSGFLLPLEVFGADAELADEMLRRPLAGLTERQWSRQTAAGLRRRLFSLIEEHTERRLLTIPFLESLS